MNAQGNLDENLVQWLGLRVGSKRMANLEPVFWWGSFEIRAERRTANRIREVVAGDRLHLLSLLKASNNKGGNLIT